MNRLVLPVLFVASVATAQEPLDTVRIEKLTGANGALDAKEGVFKVSVPRTDLSVTAAGVRLTPPLGLTSWAAFRRAGKDVMVMGDLVLLEDQVNPVMSAALDNGLEVTALHNHFFWEQPRIFYMHVHGMGTPADLARRLKPAIDVIDRAAKAAPPSSAPAAATGSLDAASLAQIIGHAGGQNGPVYKITIGRPDITLKEHGATINARMGLNTWAAFAGSDADAMVAGDVAMLAPEVTGVLKALRGSGLHVVAIHHHMTGVEPMVVFLHYYGTGPAAQLAKGVRSALDALAAKAGAARP